jgi:acyl-CoA thioesterase FadM
MAEGLEMMMLGLGFDPNEPVEGQARGLPSVGFSAKFLAAPRLYAWVTHRVAVVHVGNKSLTLSHRFSDDETLFAEAEETRIFVTYGSDGMTSIEVPRELRAKLESDLVIAGSRSGARASN